MNILIIWAVCALAVGIAAYLLPGVEVDGVGSAFLTALVLGLLNAFVKPLFVFLTLPLTILTLGLFLVVINALLVMLAARIVPGFHVKGFWPAVFFSVVLTVVGLVLFKL